MRIFEGQSGLAILLATVVGGYLFFRPSSDIDASHQIPNRVVQTQEKAPKEISIPEPRSEKSASSVTEDRLRYNRMALSGIVQVPTLRSGNKITVSVLPKPEAQWCKVGDFDLIKSLAKNAKDKMMVLSIESLRKNGPTKYESLSLGDLTSSRGFSFDLPLSNGSYGLYLCMDQSGKKTCKRKAPLDAKIWKADAKAKQNLARDKVFYFQLLHVNNGTLNIIPSDDWGPTHIAKLKDDLGDWMGGDGKAFDLMAKLVSRLQPMPARLSDAKIEIPLPYNDLRCISH